MCARACERECVRCSRVFFVSACVVMSVVRACAHAACVGARVVHVDDWVGTLLPIIVLLRRIILGYPHRTRTHGSRQLPLFFLCVFAAGCCAVAALLRWCAATIILVQQQQATVGGRGTRHPEASLWARAEVSRRLGAVQRHERRLRVQVQPHGACVRVCVRDCVPACLPACVRSSFRYVRLDGVAVAGETLQDDDDGDDVIVIG